MLFATWPQEKLKELILCINGFLYQESISQQNKNYLPQPNIINFTKKKVISSTNRLIKFNKTLFISISVCFAVLSLYPLVNLIYVFEFVQEFTYNANEISETFNIACVVDTLYGLNYILIQQGFNKNETIDNKIYLYLLRIEKAGNDQLQIYYDLK